jgi:ribosomal protein S27AE
MKLTQDQANRIIQQLNDDRDRRLPCGVCGNNNWIINDTIWEIREFNGGDFVLGGNTSLMPMISISCSKCGNTHFLNAIKLGVISPKQQNNVNENTSGTE